jgi:hypothetical protein
MRGRGKIAGDGRWGMGVNRGGGLHGGVLDGLPRI